MKTAVIYKSKTGFTGKYAEWIAEAVNADLFSADKVNIENLESYDTVIFGGSLYAVGINGIRLITGNMERLKNKKIVVFATGASPARFKVAEEVKKRNFTREQQEKIKFFYLRGGFDYQKLGVTDKILMLLLKWKILSKKKELRSDDEIGMLAIYNTAVDYTDKKNMEPLLAYLME